MPSGHSLVSPPSLPPSISFLMRMLAKVPRIMTSWLPRRAPYWLKSAAATPRPCRYFAAGLVLAMPPAGLIWSVVIESPSSARILRALQVGDRRGGQALHAREIGRQLDVGAAVVPAVGHRRIVRADRGPMRVAGEHVGVGRVEALAGHGRTNGRVDLLRGRPDVLEVDRRCRRLPMPSGSVVMSLSMEPASA